MDGWTVQTCVFFVLLKIAVCWSGDVKNNNDRLIHWLMKVVRRSG